jgi:hypothetical protein
VETRAEHWEARDAGPSRSSKPATGSTTTNQKSVVLYSVEGCGPMPKHRTLEDSRGHKNSGCSTLDWKRPTQAKRQVPEVREEQPLHSPSYM